MRRAVILTVLVTTWVGAWQGAEAADNKAVRLLLNRWLVSQNRGDFEAYKSLYAPAFQGVRKSMDREVTLDHAGWLADRARMFKKRMKVIISSVEIRDGADGPEVTLHQRFESGRYADVGMKRIRLAPGPGGGLVIVREEMLDSQLTPEAELRQAARPLRAWLAAREAAVKQKHPGARHQLDWLDYRHSDVDIPVSATEADVVYVHETVRGPACRVSLRQVSLRWEGKEAVAGNERLMGEDCCGDQACPDRSPGGWMMRFLRACPGPAAAMFIDGKQGVRVVANSHESGGRGETSKRRIRKGQHEDLCSFQVVSFECPRSFDSGGRARCDSKARGESWDFTFLKREKDVVIESVEGTYVN